VSQPDSESTKPAGILVPKPTTTIYTILLGVATAALVVGSLALFLEVLTYDWPWNLPWRPHL
jgi:hypothetical protein